MLGSLAFEQEDNEPPNIFDFNPASFCSAAHADGPPAVGPEGWFPEPPPPPVEDSKWIENSVSAGCLHDVDVSTSCLHDVHVPSCCLHDIDVSSCCVHVS